MLLLSKITFYNCSLHLPTLSANFDVNYFWYLFIFSSHFFIIFVSISAHLRFKFYNKDYETLGSVLFIWFPIVLNSSFTDLTISVWILSKDLLCILSFMLSTLSFYSDSYLKESSSSLISWQALRLFSQMCPIWVMSFSSEPR